MRAPVNPLLGSKPTVARSLADVIQKAPIDFVESRPAASASDELRSRILNYYASARTVIANFFEYSKNMAALAEEFHAARFREAFPACPMEELTLVFTIDARETPAALDKVISDLTTNGIILKKIVFDRTKPSYHLYV